MYKKSKIFSFALAIYFVSAPLLLSSQENGFLIKGNDYFKKVEDHFGKNSDSLIFYLKLAKEQYLKGELWEDYVKCLNAFTTVYANSHDFQLSQKYASLALKESKKYLPTTNSMYSLAAGNNIYSLVYIGNFKKAISQFKDVLTIERLNKDTMSISGSLKNIGDSYSKLGDLDEAINYYNESLALIEPTKESMTNSWFSDIYKKRGIAHFKKKEYKLSLTDYTRSKNLVPNNPNKKNYLAYNSAIDINYEIAKIHLIYNNLDSMNYFINSALKLCTGEYEDQKDIGYQLLGEYFLKNSDYSKALEYFLKAEKIIKTKHEGVKKHLSFSTIYNLLAEAYLKNNNLKKASLFYKKSIVNLKSSEESIQNILVPSVTHIYNPFESIEAYIGLGKTYDKLQLQDPDSKYLKASYQSYNRAARLITEVRNSIQEETSLLRYSEIALPIYEASIGASLKMFTQIGDKEYLIQAFKQNEKSKAILLLESINETSAISFSNIPDSLRQKEKEYKLQISSINKTLYAEQNVLENQNEFKIEQLKRLQFNETEEYKELIRKIEKEYPDYYQLKYNLNSASLEDIQEKLLNSDTQVIEYFFGINNIYTFSITKNDITVNTIKNESTLESDIQQIKDFISTPPSGNNIQSEFDIYINSSKNIYDKVLKNSIHPESKHLVIIADGALGYLPFEALITSTPKSESVSYSLENLSYLIEDYTISYSYSSTLFLNSFKTKKATTEHPFFGVAPSFGLLNGKKTRVCNENALYSLQCSEDEVIQIKDKLGGKVLTGKEATLSNTKAELSNAKIIHLATHACLDDSNPEFNKIYLSDDFLSNNDLYNLKLNCELAVLSACETGSGRLAKGEGVMSLARGFINAGCPSIVMSLWSIDDCATSKIMVDFYNGLARGKAKTDALKDAKLKYIKEAKRANQHPYYWAAFVQIGNYDPVTFNSINYYYISLLGLFLIVGFFFFRKK